MKLFLLVAAPCVVFSAAAGAATIDQSTIVVDQGYGLAFSGISSNPTTVTKRAQSITSGLTGTLVQVDLQVASFGGTGDLRVEFYDGLAYLPGTVPFATILIARSVIPPLPAPTFFSLDVSYLNYHVTSGHQFSIALSAEQQSIRSDSFLWAVGTYTDAELNGFDPINYAGGEVRTTTDNGLTWSLNAADRGFRTWVDTSAVPEPQSWALMVAGFAAMGGVLRRRHTAPA